MSGKNIVNEPSTSKENNLKIGEEKDKVDSIKCC